MAENERDGLYGVVLAAGRSSRFGGGKLLATFRGRPLLSHVIEVVRASRERGLLQHAAVVVGADDSSAIRLVHAARLEPVLNHSPHLGLSHSLRLALSSATSRGDRRLGALMVFLGDQPLVRLETVAALREAWTLHPGEVVRPVYKASPETPGHPVVLDRSVWPEVERIEGDQGYGAGGVTIPVTGGNPDVNTLRDLRALEDSSDTDISG